MTQRYDFLLLPQFSHLGLALATEPLFLANWLSGKRLYRWSTASLDGRPVRTSAGQDVSVDMAIDATSDCDGLFVLASFGPKKLSRDRRLLDLLRRHARHGTLIGGLETGSEALARAGLLDGYRAAIHWDNVDAFQEVYPRVSVSTRLYELDRNRITSAGAIANLDMMLHLIATQHGNGLADEIAQHLLRGPVREASEAQDTRVGRQDVRIGQRLGEAVALMQDTLEEPIACADIARNLGLSLRQLERNFAARFGMTPARYYRMLRLNHAHNLLQQTDMTVTEVALRSGFAAPEHFTRCYRQQFGETPSRDRQQIPGAPVARRLSETRDRTDRRPS